MNNQLTVLKDKNEVAVELEQSALGFKQSLDRVKKFTESNDCNDTNIMDFESGIGVIKGAIKAIDAKRAEIKDPYLQTGKVIDAVSKEVLTPLDNLIHSIESKIVQHKQNKAQEQQEILRKKREAEIAEHNRLKAIEAEEAKKRYDAEMAERKATEAKIDAKYAEKPKLAEAIKAVAPVIEAPVEAIFIEEPVVVSQEEASRAVGLKKVYVFLGTFKRTALDTAELVANMTDGEIKKVLERAGGKGTAIDGGDYQETFSR